MNYKLDKNIMNYASLSARINYIDTLVEIKNIIQTFKF